MLQNFLTAETGSITKSNRRKRNQHHSMVIWFTGLSGAGKSTLAYCLENELFKRNLGVYVLDGDNIRSGLNKDLGFSATGRKENIRRIGEVSKLFIQAGSIVISAFISPFRKDRLQVRNLVEVNEFVEIYVKCPIETCEKRDKKGLYAKARQGIIQKFTGVDSPYEEPLNPEIIVETSQQTIEESLQIIINYLQIKKYIN